MPYIRVSVTQELTPEKQQELADGLCEAISKIPGKDESTLIVDVEGGKTLFFGGVRQDDMVFADVSYFSNFSHQIKKDFTEAAFDAMSRVLGTSKDRMCLTINEYNNWGALGTFRDEYYTG